MRPERLRRRAGWTRPPSLAGRIVAGLLTFHFVALCWVFFRAKDFDAARAVLAKIAEGTWYAPNLTPNILFVLGIAVAAHGTRSSATHTSGVYYIAVA